MYEVFTSRYQVKGAVAQDYHLSSNVLKYAQKSRRRTSTEALSRGASKQKQRGAVARVSTIETEETKAFRRFALFHEKVVTTTSGTLRAIP